MGLMDGTTELSLGGSNPLMDTKQALAELSPIVSICAKLVDGDISCLSYIFPNSHINSESPYKCDRPVLTCDPTQEAGPVEAYMAQVVSRKVIVPRIQILRDSASDLIQQAPPSNSFTSADLTNALKKRVNELDAWTNLAALVQCDAYDTLYNVRPSAEKLINAYNEKFSALTRRYKDTLDMPYLREVFGLPEGDDIKLGRWHTSTNEACIAALNHIMQAMVKSSKRIEAEFLKGKLPDDNDFSAFIYLVMLAKGPHLLLELLLLRHVASRDGLVFNFQNGLRESCCFDRNAREEMLNRIENLVIKRANKLGRLALSRLASFDQAVHQLLNFLNAGRMERRFENLRSGLCSLRELLQTLQSDGNKNEVSWAFIQRHLTPSGKQQKGEETIDLDVLVPDPRKPIVTDKYYIPLKPAEILEVAAASALHVTTLFFHNNVWDWKTVQSCEGLDWVTEDMINRMCRTTLKAHLSPTCSKVAIRYWASTSMIDPTTKIVIDGSLANQNISMLLWGLAKFARDQAQEQRRIKNVDAGGNLIQLLRAAGDPPPRKVIYPGFF